MSIQERQNSDYALALLTSQCLLYSRAKKIRNATITLVAVVAVLGVAAAILGGHHFERFLPFFVLLSWLFDQQVLKKRERILRMEAATLQEAFDCFVLDLPWPFYTDLQRPTPDRVRQLATAAGRQDLDILKDWYPPAKIPPQPDAARLHCQRTNCWWDVNLRGKWTTFVRASLWALSVLLLFVATATGLSVSKLIAILACNIRTIAWGLAEIDCQSAARRRLARLHSILSDSLSDVPSPVNSRRVQDVILDHRCSALPVPDWFYRWHREDQEHEAGGAKTEP